MIILLPKSISFRLVSLVILFSLFMSCMSWTKWSPQAAGSPAPRSRTAMRTFAPFWRIGNGYSSALIVRNTSTESSTRATPIIFTADNRQIRLPAIALAPGEVKRIYLEEALPAAGSSADSGALAVQIDQSQSATVIGEVVITNYQQGIIFDIPLHAGYAGSEAKTLHSSWWLPDDKTEGRIILFNASEQAIVAHPSITTNVSQHSFANVNLAPHESKKLDLREMIRQSEDNEADRGSITVSYDGPQQALLPALLLFNSRNGFSLANRFFAKHSQSPNLASTVTWYYPIVVTGKADPARGFQRESKFTAYALISNPTSTMITPRLTATFTPESGGTQGLNLPVSPLPPMTTNLVDLSESTKESLPRNVSSFSLQVSHEGATGDLAVHVFSVDHKKDFVFTSEGTAQLRNRLDSIYWNIADDLQSLLVLQNAGDSSVEAQATLTYDTSDGRTQKYKLPVLGLPARATRLVNLRQIITAGQPDETGQLIPPGTNFGTLTIEPVAGQHSDALVGGNVTLDPDAGTCGGDVLPICGPDERPGFDGCDIIPIIIILCELYCDPGTPPHLTSISPAASAVGHPVHVTLSGTGFASGASINAGSGVTVSEVTVSSSTTMSADFAVDANATAGNRNVTVIVNGQESNSKTFVVQIPDRLVVVIDTGNLPFANCTYVIGRQITYQVADSSTSHSAIAQAIWVGEDLLNQTTNTCGNGQPPTFCDLTDSSGQFQDKIAVTGNCASSVALSNCSSNPACGYEYTQKWSTCSQDGSIELTSVPGITHCNEIKINNSTQFSPGTLMPK